MLCLLVPLAFDFTRALDQMPGQLVAIAVALALVAACVTVLSVRQARYRYACLAALSVFLALPMLAQCELTSRASNDEHRSGIAFVMAHTRPDEAVFDGYMGYGLFRPHSYWWWFLHDEVQLMLSAHEKGAAIVQALERARPPVVLYDCWVEALEPVVDEYIRDHYEPTPLSQIWVRKTRTTLDVADVSSK